MITPGIALKSWSVDDRFLIHLKGTKESLDDKAGWLAVGLSNKDPECSGGVGEIVAYCRRDIALLIAAIPDFINLMELAVTAGDSDFDPSLLVYKAKKIMKKSGIDP